MKKTRRSISLVKRNNQKRNKLVKRGKLKPNSRPRYVPSLRKQVGGGNVRNGDIDNEARKRGEEERERLQEEAYEELAAQFEDDDLEFLKSSASKGLFTSLEESALQRIEKASRNETPVKALLPIKNKDGKLSQRSLPIEVEKKVEEKDDEDEASSEKMDEDDNKNIQEISVINLMAQRKSILEEKKIIIGSLASNFLENPEERVHVLEKLIRMIDNDEEEEESSIIRVTLFRLVSSTLLEIFKDVIPSYRIIHQTGNENSKLKKDTLKLRKYENAILSCVKTFLVKLEKRLKKDEKAASLHALKCMGELLIAHPHFNYASNIVKLTVPFLNHRNSSFRSIMASVVETIFRNDKRGEISLEIVRTINGIVKKTKVRAEAIKVLQALNLQDVNFDRKREEEMEKVKNEKRLKNRLLRDQRVSKNEKKRKRKMEKLEKELLEAKGEEAEHVKDKFHTENAKIVFAIYFRILKSRNPKLIGPVLSGLAKFCHAINIEFFQDLLKVLSELTDSLNLLDNFRCIKTVLSILSGQGDTLTVDPNKFYSLLYSKLLHIDVSRSDCVPLCISALNDMLIKRRKKVGQARVSAFAKRVATVSLQAESKATLAFLALLRDLFVAHPRLRQSLKTSDEFGNCVFKPEVEELDKCNVLDVPMWEFQLLKLHFDEDIRILANHIIEPSRNNLPRELRRGPSELLKKANFTFLDKEVPKACNRRVKKSYLSSRNLLRWQKLLEEKA